MAYGFEIRDSSGAVQIDSNSIGLQAVYKTVLTSVSTDITFTSKYSPFFFTWISMHSQGFTQNITYSDITPSGAPVDEYTFRVVILYGKTLGDVSLTVFGGDASDVILDSSSGTGGAL
jgi:hypothetical protein